MSARTQKGSLVESVALVSRVMGRIGGEAKEA